MVLCLVSLWGLAVGFEKLNTKVLGPRKVPDPQAIAALPAAPLPFPTTFAVIGILILVAAEVGTESWYRYHEAKLSPPAKWAIDWPEASKSFKRGEFPDRTRAILKYNEADTASWVTSDGFGFQMYHIRWHPGRVSKFLSGAHYPTVCLPATGLKLKTEFGPFPCRVGNTDIPFTAFLFESGSQPVYVFHAILEDQPAPDGEKISYRQVSTEERIESVKRGHRNLGQRVLGISVLGAMALDEAESIVRSELNKVIHITPQSVASR
jgi:hypothetical protein